MIVLSPFPIGRHFSPIILGCHALAQEALAYAESQASGVSKIAVAANPPEVDTYGPSFRCDGRRIVPACSLCAHAPISHRSSGLKPGKSVLVFQGNQEVRVLL